MHYSPWRYRVRECLSRCTTNSLHHSWYILTNPLPQHCMTAFPAVVGCVKATSPLRGSSRQPCTKVLAAAVSKRVAIPCRRCAEETKRRGIPRGVGSGSGWQNSPELVSTARSGVCFSCVDGRCSRLDVESDAVLSLGDSPTPSSRALAVSSGDAMAMAVDIRWAMTHPTIFSLCVFVCEGTRKR